MKERSLVLLKPDSVQRGLIGEILQRFEKTGLKIVAMKPVGNYAYSIAFSDGHDSGIFTLQQLWESGTVVSEAPP